jgi:hypothetical protein
MNNFHSPFGAFAAADFGAAASWRRKSPVSDSTRTRILAKYAWLRNEDKRLKHEFDSKDAKGAKAVFRKLARMRDHFRKAAKNAARTSVGERLSAGYLTLGVSELARALFKKPLKAAIKAHILKLLAKADACDLLLRYWAGKFRVRAAELRKKAAQNEAYKALFLRFIETLKEADKVTADGSTEGAPAEPGDESITEVVEVATESDDVDDPLGFMGLSGNEVMACGALGALAGLAMS